MSRSCLARSVGCAVVVLVAASGLSPAARAEEPGSAPGAVAAQKPGPLGLEEHQSGAEVTLLELRRTSGDTVTVKWQYRNGSDEQQTIDPLISEDTYLVDAANKKKYFAVKDSKGEWVANKVPFNKVYLEPGKTLKMWAKFPAPPAATTSLTVYVMGVAPFEDVPIGP